jgi:formylmethanofuran dehydrogenase subunit E
MINPKEYFESGLALHGHKCPAMPLGMRAGAAAMNKLGVERAKDGQLLALIEIGEHHCATCFADGVQMISGCTFGKGNVQKLDYGKWGVTLVDKKRQKAVRVVPHAAVMQANKASEFFQSYRMKGVPASQVPPAVVEPLIEKVMNMPEGELFHISEVFDYPYTEPRHSFDSFVCEECGEMVAEPFGRIKKGGKVCIPCAGKNA